jgi:hypothetical protein
VRIRKAKGVYHHRLHPAGLVVMGVFELQCRNERVFVQSRELVGQFLEGHVGAPLRCQSHSSIAVFRENAKPIDLEQQFDGYRFASPILRADSSYGRNIKGGLSAVLFFDGWPGQARP